MIIVHLTDIHLKENKEENWILDRIDKLCVALNEVVSRKDKIIFLVSGDIAYSGKKEEYAIAQGVFAEISSYLETHFEADVEMLFVPGNHDCDFGINASVRNVLLKSIDANFKNDYEIIKQVATCQEEFFCYTNRDNNGQLCIDKEITYEDKKILCLMYNTAWMSILHEQPGKLIMPIENLKEYSSSEYDCVIAIMHHPYNWLNPDNSAEFMGYIRRNVDILFMGHEHRKEDVSTQSKEWSLMEYRGKELQGDDKEKDCAFSVYALDEAFQNITVTEFNWDNKKFQFCHEKKRTEVFMRNSMILKSILNPSKEFMRKIEDPEMIINHFNVVNEVTLSEIFCWPYLEQIDFQDKGTEQIIKEKIYDELLTSSIAMIIGDSLMGKTALSKMLFKKFCGLGYTCVICNGEQLNKNKKEDLIEIIEDVFVQQYSKETLSKFNQQDSSEKILIIDNFNNILYKDDRRINVISALKEIFGNIIMFSDNIIDMPILCSKINDIENVNLKIYKLMYFGNTKRRELVERWYCLDDEYAIGTRETEERVAEACYKIDDILGRNGGIVPATPFTLINLLQNIDISSASFNGSQYGFLYETLINKSLAGISKQHYKDSGDVNIDVNIMSYLAFKILTTKNSTYTFTKENVQQIVREFEELKTIYVKEEDILKKMLSAKILSEVGENTYKFKYPYIFYYFAGRYIAYNADKKEVKEQLDYMSTRLYNEKYGNIIIFVCHFANNKDIIESVLCTAYMSLDKYEPFEFDRHSEIFNRANRLIENILIPKTVGKEEDVKKYNEQELIAKDDAGIQDGKIKESEDIYDDETQQEKEMAEMTSAMRTIDVLGQIIRNYPGDIDGEMKSQIIDEIHKLGMRIIETMLSIIGLIEKDFIEFIIDKVKEKNDMDKRDVIIRKAQELLSGLIAGMVRGVVNKIAFSMSHKSLLRAVEVTFSKTNSVSQKIILEDLKFNVLKKPDVDEVSTLYNQLCRNTNTRFASVILKSIIAQYLQHNECGYKMRNQLCSIFDLSSEKYLVENVKYKKKQE